MESELRILVHRIAFMLMIGVMLFSIAGCALDRAQPVLISDIPRGLDRIRVMQIKAANAHVAGLGSAVLIGKGRLATAAHAISRSPDELQIGGVPWPYIAIESSMDSASGDWALLAVPDELGSLDEGVRVDFERPLFPGDIAYLIGYPAESPMSLRWLDQPLVFEGVVIARPAEFVHHAAPDIFVLIRGQRFLGGASGGAIVVKDTTTDEWIIVGIMHTQHNGWQIDIRGFHSWTILAASRIPTEALHKRPHAIPSTGFDMDSNGDIDHVYDPFGGKWFTATPVPPGEPKLKSQEPPS